MRTAVLVFGIVLVIFILCSYIHGLVVDSRMNSLKIELREIQRSLNSHVHFESTLHHLNTTEMEIKEDVGNVSEE